MRDLFNKLSDSPESIVSKINHPYSYDESEIEEIGANQIPDIAGAMRDLITHEEDLLKYFLSLEEDLSLIQSKLDDMTEAQAEQAWVGFSESIGFSGSLGRLITGVAEAREAATNSINDLNQYPTASEDLLKAFQRDPGPVLAAGLFTATETVIVTMLGFGLAGPAGAAAGLAFGGAVGGLLGDAETDHMAPIMLRITSINNAAEHLGRFAAKVEDAMPILDLPLEEQQES